MPLVNNQLSSFNSIERTMVSPPTMLAISSNAISQFDQPPANNMMVPLVNNQLASNINLINNSISPAESSSSMSSTNGENVNTFCNNNNNNNRTQNKNNTRRSKKGQVCTYNTNLLRKIMNGNPTENLDEIYNACKEHESLFKVYETEKKKKYSCKRCKMEFARDSDYYAHYRTHFAAEKLVTCKHCHFVTELRHHVIYHAILHWRIKPLKCKLCDYVCNNKTMLESHMKSHSELVNFHCYNCDYSSRYLHSMKKHLRKEKHKQGLTYDKDGNVSRLEIDVEGSRRGPKYKTQILEKVQLPKSKPKPKPVPTSTIAAISEPQPSFAMFQQQQILNQLHYFFNQVHFDQFVESGHINPQISSFLSIQNGNSNELTPNNNLSSSESAFFEHSDSLSMSSFGSNANQDCALDLSKSGTASLISTPEVSPISQETSRSQSENPQPKRVKTEEYVQSTRSDPCSQNENPQAGPVKTDDFVRFPYICEHCNMAFADSVKFTIHMGFHGSDNPFKCNRCGKVTQDSIHFFTHTLTSSHSGDCIQSVF